MTARKVILVTGATSGIGLACARRLHEDGHIVYGASRSAARTTPGWRTLELDVTSDASVAQAIETVRADEGRLDVLINNAGVVYAGAIETTSIVEAQRQFDVNFFGPLRLCRAALPLMRAEGAGLIINVSSLAGLLGLPFQGLYSASKFALEGLTEALRQEVGGFGVEVVLLEPGDIATSVVQNRVRAAQAKDDTIYAENFARVVALYEKEETAGAQPSVVAARVAAIIATNRPAVRYTTGPLGQRILTALKPFLPSRFFESRLMAYYGLKR